MSYFHLLPLQKYVVIDENDLMIDKIFLRYYDIRVAKNTSLIIFGFSSILAANNMHAIETVNTSNLVKDFLIRVSNTG